MKPNNKNQSNIAPRIIIVLMLLTLAAFVLRITGVVSWSWAWVFSPILIPASIVGLILSIVVVGALLMMVADELKRRGKGK